MCYFLSLLVLVWTRTFRHMQYLIALIRFPAYRNGNCLSVYGRDARMIS
jgi:hypothetical protein